MQLQERLAAAKAAANAEALDTFLACTESISMPKDQARTKMMGKLEEYQAQHANGRYDGQYINSDTQSKHVKGEDTGFSEAQLDVTHPADYQEELVSKGTVSSLTEQYSTRPISNPQVSKNVHVQNSEQAYSICQQDNITAHQNTCQSNSEHIATHPGGSSTAVTRGVRKSSISEKQIDHHVQTPEAPQSLFHGSLAKLYSSHKRKRTESTDCKDHNTAKKRFRALPRMPRATNFRGNLQKLRYIRTLVQEYSNSYTNDDHAHVIERKAQKIRDYLHEMAFFDFVDDNLINQSRVLQAGDGLRSIFLASPMIFPEDICDDAWGVFRRWYMENYDPDLLLGITTVPADRRRGIPLHRVHDQNHGPPFNSAIYGHDTLALGQWWPFQICAVRDGAHGELEAGICGDLQHGAYSIVMSGCKYDDIDNGNVIEYCGTKGTVDQITAGTNQLLRSYELQNDIRVLRSHKLPKENKYRPIRGIRYDGLYKITNFVIIDPNTSHHRFRLVRNRNQTPLRYQGVLQRPTVQELIRYEELRYRIS